VKGFPDIEAALIEILSTVAAAGTATDENLAIPIRVNRTGGPTRPWQDEAIVEVTCFCATRPEAVALNRQVLTVLLDLRGVQTTAGLIDKISNYVSPLPLPDLNPDTRKVSSTWTVVSRLQDVPS